MKTIIKLLLLSLLFIGCNADDSVNLEGEYTTEEHTIGVDIITITEPMTVLIRATYVEGDTRELHNETYVDNYYFEVVIPEGVSKIEIRAISTEFIKVKTKVKTTSNDVLVFEREFEGTSFKKEISF